MVAAAKKAKKQEPSEDARQRLIEAALTIFSQYSYEGATTRMIAEQAGVNLAAIPYYFGGKEGLYRAMVETVVDRFQTVALPAVQELQQKIEKHPPSPSESVDYLCLMLGGFTENLLSLNIPRPWMRLAFGEETAPIKAFDYLYESVIRHIHHTASLLVGRALGLPADSRETILRTQAILGQVITFHLSREVVFKRLNQTEYSQEDIGLLREIIQGHVRAILGTTSVIKPHSTE
jgi:AcrR family transcriptional regulator